jgi:DNA-binding NtrC family response regulator
VVLVVDDDRSVRQLTGRLLAELGHEVLVADSGEDALRLFASHPRPIDLLVTDLVMPGMSGRQLAERVRQVEPGLPVVYMSGDPTAVIEPENLPPGIFFLAKPFQAEMLFAVVDEARRGRGS